MSDKGPKDKKGPKRRPYRHGQDRDHDHAQGDHDHRPGHNNGHAEEPETPPSFVHTPNDDMAAPVLPPTFGGPVVPPSPPSPTPATTLPFSILPISISSGSSSTSPVTSDFDSSTTFVTSSILTSSPTATASAPSTAPSSPPSFSLLSPSNATSCSPQQIRWAVSNPAAANLTGMSIDLSIISAANNDVNLTLTTDWPVLNAPFTWSSASVPPGEYLLIGRCNGATIQSPTFDVQPGSDTSCLTAAPGDGPAPINTASSSVNKGVIAGATVGSVLLLASIFAFFFWWNLHTRRPSKRASGRSSGWGGLGSIDDKGPHSRGVMSSDSHDYLGANPDYLVANPDYLVPDPPPDPPAPGGMASATSLDAEKLVAPTTPPPVSPLQHEATPLELAPLPSRPTTQDSLQVSVEDPFVPPPSRRASRTTRKPVPAYDRHEIESMAMASSVTDSMYQPSTSFGDSSATYHELQHKSSGTMLDKPVHYLIPDPPPQQPPSA